MTPRQTPLDPPRLPPLEGEPLRFVRAMAQSFAIWREQHRQPLDHGTVLLLVNDEAGSAGATYMAERTGCNWQRISKPSTGTQWAWVVVGARPYEEPAWHSFA